MNFRQIKNRQEGIIEFDLNELIKQLLDVSKKRFESNHIKINYYNQKITNVTLNNVDVQSILINLLNNAFDAVMEKDSGREIIINVDSQADKQFSIEIEDSGKGVPEKIKDHIFAAFFSTKGVRGMGLGLFLMQRLTLEMGGKIVLEKSHLGGAKFKVLLPLEIKK